jgi:hypothetical protein
VLRVGTRAFILGEVTEGFHVERPEVIRQFFGSPTLLGDRPMTSLRKLASDRWGAITTYPEKREQLKREGARDSAAGEYDPGEPGPLPNRIRSGWPAGSTCTGSLVEIQSTSAIRSGCVSRGRSVGVAH